MRDTFPAEPFFLKTATGKRFCLYHAPASSRKCPGVFIYVHPFGDEMNKSRRMAAMQSRALAETGFGVLQIDLYGCGDSDGEFGDARWNIWKADLASAYGWIRNRALVPVSLWGLRLGALLALDFASDCEKPIDKIILWQPVLDGASFLNQFLRLRLASEMFSNATGPKGVGTAALRERLANGETLEVAGYELSPELAAAIERFKAVDMAIQKCIVHWFEIIAEPGRSISHAGMNVINRWKLNGLNIHVHLVPCAPFWATQEISECAELISETSRALVSVS